MLLRVITRTLLAACLLAGSLFGQGTTSRAVGIIQDSTGSVVPGATVRLTNEGTNTTFTVTSAENGVYVFEAVQTGSYTLTVEASGFKKFTAKGNPVSIGQPLTVNVTLEVGAVTETVEVAGAYETVQTSTSGNFGNLFEGQVIRDLPIVGTRGRNPLELVLRQPGVVSGANTGGGTHVHGARDRAWNFTLDGIDINETSAGGSNFSPLRTNPDSLAEFRVLTSNFTAEYGRNSGGQVAMITRSGSNQFHGDGFWFYRTPRLNANEWQNNLNNLGQRQFVQNIWGGSLGGPIRRNKTFFFTNLQWLRARESAVTDRTVYTQSARQGIWRYVRGGRNGAAGGPFAAVDFNGHVLPGRDIGTYNIAASDPQRLGMDQRIRGLIEASPLPNNFTGGDGLNTALFTFTALQQERQYDAVFKIDHNINDRNTVYARLAFGQQNTNCDRVNGGSEFFPGTGCVVNTLRSPRNYAFNWRTTPTASVTNELVVGFNNFAFDFQIPTADLNKITLTSPVTIPETFSFGNLRELTTYQFVDNLAWFRGTHAIKFGANVRLQRHRDTRGSIAGLNANQSVNFSTAVSPVDPATFGLPRDINVQFDQVPLQAHVNFLLGRVGTTSKAFVAQGDQFVNQLYNVTSRYDEYDFYWQDNWKLRRNLTIDVGLRWEWKLSPRAGNGIIRAPNALMTAGAAATNTLRWEPRAFYGDDLNNLGPSLGLAWDPSGKGKSSVRANYRIAYDRINTFAFSSSVLQNLPGVAQGVVNQAYGQGGGRLGGLPVLQPPSLSPNSLAQPPAFSNNSITVVDPDFRMPMTHQWGLSLQQEIMSRTVVEINYIGRRAYGLFGAYNANQTEIFRNGFLDAFKIVQAGGQSDLMNRLLLPDTRRQANETGSNMIRRLFPADLRNNSVGAVAGNIAARIQGSRSVADLSDLGTFYLTAFPQFLGGVNVIDSNDFSTYHAVEFQVERRFHNGLSWQASYTLSKSLDTRSYDPAFTVVSGANNQSASSTPFDLSNRKLNYALSDFDRTHVVQSFWSFELPFGRGRRYASSAGAWMNRVIGGWQLSGFMTLQGGRPFTIYSGSNTVSNVNQSPANCSGCTRADGRVFDDPSQGLKFYLNESERNRFSIPGPGELGNTGRNFLRGPGSFSMDAAFLKRTPLTERTSLELRADMTNITNTPTFGFPTATFTSTIFGRIRDSVISGSRKIQLGAKLHF
ncbi:MAG: hypothetical protein FJW20_01905 [Acidimicrobiia bacterium]|nr:hypothetical protein [Acidimicrobiia bacterium]